MKLKFNVAFKFSFVPVIIAVLFGVTTAWLGIWVADGSLMPLFGVRGSIFWLFWLDVLTPFQSLGGNSVLMWFLAVALFWLPIGFLGGMLCKKRWHFVAYFVAVFIFTFLLALYMNWPMVSGEAGGQIWVPMMPV